MRMHKHHNSGLQLLACAVYIINHSLLHYDLFMLARYSPVYNTSLVCMQVVMLWKIIKPDAAGGEQSEPPACNAMVNTVLLFWGYSK